MPSIDEQERVAQIHADLALDTLANKLLGHGISVTKNIKVKRTSGYGTLAGSKATSSFEIKGVITGNEFATVDSLHAGLFDTGWLYTTSDQVNVGDEVAIAREDGRERKYTVETKTALGSTRAVFTRHRLAALGD